jgi:ribose-phosphate pyrophosphokinase
LPFNAFRLPQAMQRDLHRGLAVPMHEIELHRFPDGELRVRVGPAASTTIIYIAFDQPNDKLLTVLFAAEALRRDGAERLVLVAPYLCYMRQDAAEGDWRSLELWTGS